MCKKDVVKTLSEAGKELLTVARTSRYGDEYIQDIMELIKKKTRNCNFTLHKVNFRSGEMINYNLEEIMFDYV